MNQQIKRNPQCSCINCDRSCFRGKTGTVHHRTSRETAKIRLKDLREWIEGKGEKPCP